MRQSEGSRENPQSKEGQEQERDGGDGVVWCGFGELFSSSVCDVNPHSGLPQVFRKVLQALSGLIMCLCYVGSLKKG